MQNNRDDLRGRCYEFSLNIINCIDRLSKDRSCFVISDQLMRSGTSIGANLTEASAASSKADFKRYHEIALKSANETRYWLGLLKDAGKVEDKTVNPLIIEVTELSNMIAAGILKMKGKR